MSSDPACSQHLTWDKTATAVLSLISDSKFEFRKPVNVLTHSRIFCRLWVIKKHIKFYIKNIQECREFLENCTSTCNYFTGSFKLRPGRIKNFNIFYSAKSLFYTRNRGFPEEAFKCSLEYLNTALALLVRLILARLYIERLFSSFVRLTPKHWVQKSKLTKTRKVRNGSLDTEH